MPWKPYEPIWAHISCYSCLFMYYNYSNKLYISCIMSCGNKIVSIQNVLTSVKSHTFMSGWKFMPFLHFLREGTEVFFEDSSHLSLTDSCFCSHFWSRTTWIPSQLSLVFFTRRFVWTVRFLPWSGRLHVSPVS